MNKVTIDEIVQTLVSCGASQLASAIREHGIAPPEGYCIVPVEILDLTRFMCSTWTAIDEWAYKANGEALMSYPVIQGTSNQIALTRIGEQPYNNKNIPIAVKWMLEASKP